jgi:peptidyl-prolyl cis-trans isomerase C
MKTSSKILFFSLLVLLALMSCKKQGPPSDSKTEKSGTAIATVNGVPITDEEVKFEISLLPDELQGLTESGEGLATLLDEILKKEMLYQEAKKKKLDETEEYRRRLHDLERKLIVEMLLIDEIEKKASVTDEEAKKFYDDNREKFTSPPSPGSKGKGKLIPFEQVEDLIKSRLLGQKQRQAFEDYVASLSESYKVELNEEAIKDAFGISVGEKSENSGEAVEGIMPKVQNNDDVEENPSESKGEGKEQ